MREYLSQPIFLSEALLNEEIIAMFFTDDNGLNIIKKNLNNPTDRKDREMIETEINSSGILSNDMRGNDRIILYIYRRQPLTLIPILITAKSKKPILRRVVGGNKYDKYTLNDLKQIAIDNKIKITKMVVISNDELHKKLKDKDIIINKNIKLEDFKRILKENNIKITKKVNLTKQELIKKLEIQI